MALIGIFTQTAGSTCEFWVNPVNFTFHVAGLERRAAHAVDEQWTRDTDFIRAAHRARLLAARRDGSSHAHEGAQLNRLQRRYPRSCLARLHPLYPCLKSNAGLWPHTPTENVPTLLYTPPGAPGAPESFKNPLSSGAPGSGIDFLSSVR